MRRNLAAALLVMGLLWAVSVTSIAQGPPPPAATLTPAQLQTLVAPIALYPDALLSQVLMASAYPMDVFSADRWAQANASLSPSARLAALQQQTWDTSAKSLTQFPKLLHRMAQNLPWTTALGEAYLAQPKDLMGTVQQLRADAYKSGALKSTQQQVVNNQDNTIVIQPANAQVVYVPDYNPQTIYGGDVSFDTTDYSGMYDPTGYNSDNMLDFSTPIAMDAAPLYGGVDWASGNLTYAGAAYGAYGAAAYAAGYHPYGGAAGASYNYGSHSWTYNPAARQGVNYNTASLQSRYGSAGSGYNGYHAGGEGDYHSSFSNYSGDRGSFSSGFHGGGFRR